MTNAMVFKCILIKTEVFTLLFVETLPFCIMSIMENTLSHSKW